MDGSMGRPGSLAGPDYAVPETLGTIKGENLFHSFLKFNLVHGESATFTGPGAIRNVISRVTGGEPSAIDGLIRSTLESADFFFINPSGVVFGPNAGVDVPAAFHVSTADELKFNDGYVFSTSSLETSTLTQAAPESFGFLGKRSASIEIRGSVLKFMPETDISFSAADINFQPFGDKFPEIKCERGTIHLAAMGEKNVNCNLDAASIFSSDAGGELGIHSARLDVSGNGGGSIAMTAGKACIENAFVISDNTGDDVPRGGIYMDINGPLELTKGSRIQSHIAGAGDSGSIRIDADSLLIKQESGERLTGIFIETKPDSIGNGSLLALQIQDTFRIEGGGAVSSTTYGEGDAASILISAGDVFMDGQGRVVPHGDGMFIAGISSESSGGARGNAGSVSIFADGSFELMNMVEVSTSTDSQGDGGDIIISAERILIDGKGNGAGIFSNAFGGYENNAGIMDIFITGLLDIKNGGRISSSTFSEGNAGTVTVNSGQLKIDGNASPFLTGINSNALPGSGGNAGTVSINVDGVIQLSYGGQISSSTFSEGHAGKIIVTGNELIIDEGGCGVFTGILSSAEPGSLGMAGNVNVEIENLLELTNGGELSTSTHGKGDAGDLVVHAGGIKIDDRNLSDSFTGLVSNAGAGSEGNAGEVEVWVPGLVEIVNGGIISSITQGRGDGRSVELHAGALVVDGGSVEQPTGILSQADSGSQGNAGTVQIHVAKMLQLKNGAQISSSTLAKGDAGKVVVNAENLSIEGDGNHSISYIGSLADINSRGEAGLVTINVMHLLELVNGARITTHTWGKGNAGTVTVNSGQLKIDGNASPFLTGINSNALPGSGGNAGTVSINVDGVIQLSYGGQISSSTFSEGHAGKIIVTGNELIIDEGGCGVFTGILSSAEPGSLGMAGNVNVEIENLLELTNGGELSTSTHGKGDAGDLVVHAGGIKIDDRNLSDSFTGLVSNAGAGSKGDAGEVKVSVTGLLEMMNGGIISSITQGEGDGGEVNVSAGDLVMDGCGIDQATGILGRAGGVLDSNAGDVEVTVSNLLQLKNGATISSSASSSGNAGGILVHAGALTIDGQGKNSITGIKSQAALAGSQGDAGRVEINVEGAMRLINGADISSSKVSKGNAGKVIINTDALFIDGGDGNALTGITNQNLAGSEGNAGTIEITANVIQMINGAQISTSTWSKCDAGSVIIHAGHLMVDGGVNDHVTSIMSQAEAGSEGNAGRIDTIITGAMEVLNDAQISSSTFSKGNAGDVSLNASEIIIDSGYVLSAASPQSTGAVGDISINADVLSLYNESAVAIAAFQRYSPDSLSDQSPGKVEVETAKLHLDQVSRITSESTQNVPASDIMIKAERAIIENGSSINTSSNEADGGDITLGVDTLFLKDGQITTSVGGLRGGGDGGNIKIQGMGQGSIGATPADFLILKGGFIQANTAAENASGGNIDIDVSSVIMDENTDLEIGGGTEKMFHAGGGINVIQAAAPNGTSGEIAFDVPRLDISGSMVNMWIQFAAPVKLSVEPCLAVSGNAPNSLIQSRRSGIMEIPEKPSTLFLSEERLERLLD